MPIPYVEIVSAESFELFNWFLSLFIILSALFSPVLLVFALLQRS